MGSAARSDFEVLQVILCAHKVESHYPGDSAVSPTPRCRHQIGAQRARGVCQHVSIKLISPAGIWLAGQAAAQADISVCHKRFWVKITLSGRITRIV